MTDQPDMAERVNAEVSKLAESLRYPSRGAAYADVVSVMSDGPEFNSALITANRGRFGRLNPADKRELWEAMKAKGSAA